MPARHPMLMPIIWPPVLAAAWEELDQDYLHNSMDSSRIRLMAYLE